MIKSLGESPHILLPCTDTVALETAVLSFSCKIKTTKRIRDSVLNDTIHYANNFISSWGEIDNAGLQRDAEHYVKCCDWNLLPKLPQENDLADSLDVDVGALTSCL